MERERLALVGDPETEEMYVARVIDEELRGHGPETLPLVRILRVARYPRQRAIQSHDVALEIPALQNGLIVRMAILKRLSERERKAFLSRTYDESLRAAQEEALQAAANDREAYIIQRHMDGEYFRKRMVRSYTPTEVKFLTGHFPK